MNFVCVYYGDKYQIDYVEKLYNMVQRNTTLKHKFICFTDNTVIRRRLKHTSIEFREFVRHDFEGWFNKLQLFSPDSKLEGNIALSNGKQIPIKEGRAKFTLDELNGSDSITLPEATVRVLPYIPAQ